MITTCPTCDGTGEVEVSDRAGCRVHDCCGGCAHYERCLECEGAGEIELDDDNNEED